jgi:hypothetical protein
MNEDVVFAILGIFMIVIFIVLIIAFYVSVKSIKEIEYQLDLFDEYQKFN